MKNQVYPMQLEVKYTGTLSTPKVLLLLQQARIIHVQRPLKIAMQL